jgi:hypothetical protein
MKSSPPKKGRADSSAALADGARYAPKETPTRPSMQAIRLAEEEAALSERGASPSRRDSAESGVMATAAALKASPEVSQVARRIEKLIPRMLVAM